MEPLKLTEYQMDDTEPLKLTDLRNYSVSLGKPHTSNISKSINIPPLVGRMSHTTPDANWSWNKPDNTFDVGLSIGGLENLGLTLYDASTYNKSINDLLMDAGISSSQINGTDYQLQKTISNDELNSVKGEKFGSVVKGAGAYATAGMALGPWGAAGGAVIGAAGGLIGNALKTNSAKKKIEQANMLANNINRVNRNAAASLGMQLDYYRLYGNPESLVLYADNGKDVGSINNRKSMKLTQTNNGFLFASHNAYGKGGEVIGNPLVGQWDVIKGDRADNKPLHVEDDDVVITDKFGLAEAAIPSVIASKRLSNAIDYLQLKADSLKGERSKSVANNVIKKHVQELQQEKEVHDQKLANIAGVQHDLRNSGFLPQETMGLPHAKNGLEAGNLLNGLLGIATGVSLYIGSNRQKVKRPYTYSPNTYANRALAEADALRVNTKPIIDLIDRESAAGRYRTATAGGLSGALRYLANVANIRNTQVAKADALAKADLQNNQYRSNYAQMLATLGAQDATARMLTNQWDLDYYSKAHAARQQGMQMGVYNILNSLQQYTANANKLGMFRDMYNLYSASLTDEEREVLAKLLKGKG